MSATRPAGWRGTALLAATLLAGGCLTPRSTFVERQPVVPPTLSPEMEALRNLHNDGLAQPIPHDEKNYIAAAVALETARLRLDQAERGHERLAAEAAGSLQALPELEHLAGSVRSRQEAMSLLSDVRRHEDHGLRLQESRSAYEQAMRELMAAEAACTQAGEALAPIPPADASDAGAGLLAAEGGFAAGGYDVVAYYRENKAVPGDEAFQTEWAEARWRFANGENLEHFRNSPHLFAPRFGGRCAWHAARGRTVAGDPRHWSVFDNRLYLFASPALQVGWKLEVEKRIAEAERLMQDDERMRPRVSLPQEAAAEEPGPGQANP